MSVTLVPHAIKKLPNDLINRIAAGEVIERPASVVKELLENSLDAGATAITVTVEGGGTRLIRVQDNGHGIHKSDLLLAVDRHTTSKLTDISDLFQIRTLGFRGEALSSIASVSRFSLTSRCPDQEHAWRMTNISGEKKLQPAAHPPGTTIEVRDLFYNVPARRKFLRTVNTELLHIQDITKRLALSRQTLSLRLIHNDRQIFQVAAMDRDPAARAAAIYGHAFIKSALKVEFQATGLHLWGWIGQPEQARNLTDRQYFYLNGRAIRDKQVNHAVRLAYQDKLYPGRHPVYVLYLEMDPAAADVNVHPGKQEVRFRQPRDVHDFVFAALTQAVSSNKNSMVAESPTSVIRDRSMIAERQSEYGQVSQVRAGGVANSNADKILLIQQGEFLLADTTGGLLLIDVLRARELLAYLRFNEALQTGTLRRRPMLVPITVNVTGQEADWVTENKALLEGLSLIIDCIAPNTLMVRELPVLLADADAVALVRDVIAHCTSQAQVNITDRKLLGLMAKHVNDTQPSGLNIAWAERLLAELLSIKNPSSIAELQTVMRTLDIHELRDLLANVK